MSIYHITDWLGLVPIGVCFIFGGVGFVQLCRWRVDFDILLLGAYYLLVIGAYLAFEMVPINYRPILIEGRLEASYPSSTTLLVLSVMPTLNFQVKRRLKNTAFRRSIQVLSILFAAAMTLGRLVCGVHWMTDIIGALLLSIGLFMLYRGAVLVHDTRRN